MVFFSSFFGTLHQFYPYIPPGLQSPNNLAAHPILFVTILSISSRYCNLPEPGRVAEESQNMSERANAVHATLWTYGESLISQTVWAEASSISLATVLAFLLLSQWNPRAVHSRKGDYANPTHLPSNDEDGRGPEGGGGYGGFAAARRSDRMAWMMIGVAIRLAQDMNLFSKWREISLACFYSDITLALRLGRPSMLSYSFQEITTISFSTLDNAKLDILRILSLAHQSLYSSPGSMYKILNSENYLPLLRYFRSKLTVWNSKYQLLFRNDDIDRESLLMEFHYTELYIYSLALSPPGHRQVDESLAEVYILLATQAAQQLIAVITRVFEKGILRWAPLQWFVRSIHAAIFIAKIVALERDADPDRQHDMLSTIRSLASTLSDSSPDDIHLANKYAEALFSLCDNIEAELRKSAMQKQAAQKAETDLAPVQSIDGQGAVSQNSSASGFIHNGGNADAFNNAKAANGGVFDSAYGGTAMADVENMKWFIDSYGIGFDSNFALDQEWLSPELTNRYSVPQFGDGPLPADATSSHHVNENSIHEGALGVNNINVIPVHPGPEVLQQPGEASQYPFPTYYTANAQQQQQQWHGNQHAQSNESNRNSVMHVLTSQPVQPVDSKTARPDERKENNVDMNRGSLYRYG